MDIDDKAKHTAYISFDNNDSSISSFINYLRATFDRRGLYHLDDKDERFFDLIRVLVVVISKSYTFSALENLVKRLGNNGLLVVLVLYGVTVSSVQQQIAVLEQSSTVDQVPMWPRLLLESAVLPGHVYNDEESESEFLEEIAQDVFEKLYPTEEIGIPKRLEEINNLLCKQSWKLRTLGICGLPGTGKTTVAQAVFHRMSPGYDAHYFIKNFQTEYNGGRVKSLPDGFWKEIPMEKFDLDDVPSHRKKRVLVVLDDVRNFQDAKSFLGRFDKYSPGSLIIITSRERNVLAKCQMKGIYELKGLNGEEALKLFTRCAFGKDNVEKNLLDLSKKKIECFDGNPFNLRLSAKKFKGKTKVEIGPVLPDVCGVFTTYYDLWCDIAKDKSISITPYEEEAEPQENKELPLAHNHVLATRDTKTITRTTSDLCTEDEFQSYSRKNPRFGLYGSISKSMPSNPRVYQFDDSLIRSLFEHINRKHHDLRQLYASQIQKLGQSFSNSRDHGWLESHLQLLFNLSGGCSMIKRLLDAVRNGTLRVDMV